MPTAKERKLYDERLRQLTQLGYPITYEHQLLNHQPSEAAIEQCAPPTECLLFDLKEQGSLYIVWLSVKAKMPGVRLYDYRFVPPWPDENFQTIDTTEACRGEAYVLPNQWQFSQRDVLNLRFGAGGWRLECRPVEGWLCASSATPVPREYRRSTGIPVRVEVFGKSGRCVAETVATLCLDRSFQPTKVLQERREQAKAKLTAQREERWPSFPTESHSREREKARYGS